LWLCIFHKAYLKIGLCFSRYITIGITFFSSVATSPWPHPFSTGSDGFETGVNHRLNLGRNYTFWPVCSQGSLKNVMGVHYSYALCSFILILPGAYRVTDMHCCRYCECFAAGVYCVGSCACRDCFNKPEYEETVINTRHQIESRNPLAFAPKIVQTAESSPGPGVCKILRMFRFLICVCVCVCVYTHAYISCHVEDSAWFLWS
jgi:hypothetical protein